MNTVNEVKTDDVQVIAGVNVWGFKTMVDAFRADHCNKNEVVTLSVRRKYHSDDLTICFFAAKAGEEPCGYESDKFLSFPRTMNGSADLVEGGIMLVLEYIHKKMNNLPMISSDLMGML